MTSVTINKPSTLVAGNIKNGVNIAGVTGTYSATPAADPAVKFLGLYLYTQRGSAANPAVLENVTGCQFAGVNRRFGATAYVGIVLNAILPGKDYEFGKDEQGDTSVNFKV